MRVKKLIKAFLFIKITKQTKTVQFQSIFYIDIMVYIIELNFRIRKKLYVLIEIYLFKVMRTIAEINYSK